MSPMGRHSKPPLEVVVVTRDNCYMASVIGYVLGDAVAVGYILGYMINRKIV